MPRFLKQRLLPPPSSVLKNAEHARVRLAKKNARVVLAPHCELSAELYYGGAFHGLHVIGALDGSAAKHGIPIFGLQSYPYSEVAHLNVDAVLVANTRYHREVYASLQAASAKHGFELIDLCEGYDEPLYRTELAAQLDPFSLAKARNPHLDEVRNFEVLVPHDWGFGDALCAMSTAREIARRHPDKRIHFQLLPELVAAYPDHLLTAEPGGYPLIEHSQAFHQERHASVALNYLGCTYLGFGLDFQQPPLLDLPPLPPPKGLTTGQYIVLQPFAKCAKPNLNEQELQRIIDAQTLPVIMAGRKPADTQLQNIGFGFGETRADMLALIQHAAFVLSPRSASAHIAAAYHKKTIVWIPNDKFEWHLDYPGWPVTLINREADDCVEQIIAASDRLRSATQN